MNKFLVFFAFIVIIAPNFIDASSLIKIHDKKLCLNGHHPNYHCKAHCFMMCDKGQHCETDPCTCKAVCVESHHHNRHHRGRKLQDKKFVAKTSVPGHPVLVCRRKKFSLRRNKVTCVEYKNG